MDLPSTRVISYDIVDDRRRIKMHGLLEARATRVQKSVFEVLATDAELLSLLGEAEHAKRFRASEDSLRAYSLCATCRARARVLGVGAPPLSPFSPLAL